MSAAQPPAEAPLPGRSWYVLILLTAIFGLATIDRAVVPLVLEPMGAEFGLNDAQLGFLSGLAFGLPYTLFAIPAGFLIDRVNRRNLLGALVALWSCMTALGGLAQSYLHLVLARMAVGASESGTPAAVSLITDHFPPRRRPMALSVYQAGGSIAMGLNFAFGGWVVYEWGWRAAFFVVGLPGIALALLVLLTIREPERGATDGRGAGPAVTPPYLDTIRHLLRTPSAVNIFIAYILTNATISSFWSWSTSLLVRAHGLNVRDAGLTIAVAAGLMGFVGAGMGAIVSDRAARQGLAPVLIFIAVASAAMAPFGVAMSLAPSLWATIVLMMSVSIAKSSYMGPCQGVLMNLVGSRMRGVTSTLLNALGTLVGFSIGPLITGAISYFLGGGTAIRYGLAILFLLNLWAALHFWLASRSVETDLARVQA